MAKNPQDRYLKSPRGRFVYTRRVPKDLLEVDLRAPVIEEHLRTSNSYDARTIRDGLASRDDALWKALRELATENRTPETCRHLLKALEITPMDRYPTGIAAGSWGAQMYDSKRIDAMNLAAERLDDFEERVLSGEYVEPSDVPRYEAAINDIFADAPADVKRHAQKALQHQDKVTKHLNPETATGAHALAAATGALSESTNEAIGNVSKKSVSVLDSIDPWIKMNRSKRFTGKNQRQIDKILNPMKLAAKRFTDVIGARDILAVTRGDAVEFFDFHDDLINPPEGSDEKPRSPSSAKKDFQHLRSLWEASAKRAGLDLRDNPFAGLNFSDNNSSRKPYSVDFIKANWLKSHAFDTLNDEAFTILMILLETGARMSEICSLRAEDIRLDANACIDAMPPLSVLAMTCGPLEMRRIKAARGL